MTTSDQGMSATAGDSADPVELAVRNFASGLNCSESVMRGFNDAYHLGLPATAYGIAAPFGGGMSGARCACGGVTGGLMALGLARGGVTSGPPVSEAGRALHDRFVARFGSVCCRELTRDHAWDSPERRRACQAYVRFAAETVRSLLSDGRADQGGIDLNR